VVAIEQAAAETGLHLNRTKCCEIIINDLHVRHIQRFKKNEKKTNLLSSAISDGKE